VWHDLRMKARRAGGQRWVSAKPLRRCWATEVSARADTVRPMGKAAWAAAAGNKFREVSRSTENPTTKLLAEGLTALAEGVRELDHELENVRKLMSG
jgi:hypothetical protein